MAEINEDTTVVVRYRDLQMLLTEFVVTSKYEAVTSDQKARVERVRHAMALVFNACPSPVAPPA